MEKNALSKRIFAGTQKLSRQFRPCGKNQKPDTLFGQWRGSTMQQRVVFRNCTSVCDLEGMLILDIFFDCILLTIEIIGLFYYCGCIFLRENSKG